MITDLEKAGRLDRALEALPDDEELRRGRDSGRRADRAGVRGAARVREDRAEATRSRRVRLPDEAWTARGARELLPDAAARAVRRPDGRAPAAPRDRHHRAGQRGGQPRRHIVRLPRGGGDRGDARRTCCARTWWCARCTACATCGAAVEALDNQVPTGAQTAVYLEARRLLDRAVRWLLTNRRSPHRRAGEIARLRPGVARLLPRAGRRSSGAGNGRRCAAHVASWSSAGVPRDARRRGRPA